MLVVVRHSAHLGKSWIRYCFERRFSRLVVRVNAAAADDLLCCCDLQLFVDLSEADYTAGSLLVSLFSQQPLN